MPYNATIDIYTLDGIDRVEMRVEVEYGTPAYEVNQVRQKIDKKYPNSTYRIVSIRSAL